MKHYRNSTLIKELEKRGLGVFNLSLPFTYFPYAKDIPDNRKDRNPKGQKL